MASSPTTPPDNIFPPNSIVHLVVDIARCKRLFQHEDNARTTSSYVEAFFSNSDAVAGGWLESGDAAAEAEKEMAKTPRRGKPPPAPKWAQQAPHLGGVTKTVTESGDPFFNHPFEFVFTPKNINDNNNNNNNAGGDNKNHHHVARFHFRVCDSNYEPHRPLTLATFEVNFAKTNKGEQTLGMVLDPQLAVAVASTEPFEMPAMDAVALADVWPSYASCVESDGGQVGALTLRYSVKVTKPKPPPIDVEADLDLPMPEKLSGATPILPAAAIITPQQQQQQQQKATPPQHQEADSSSAAADQQQQQQQQQQTHLNNYHTTLPGVVCLLDPDWTLKLNKAMIKTLGALHDEEVAKSSPTRRSRNFGGSSSTRNNKSGDDSAADATQIDKVVTQYWKCRRSHQVMTKMRLTVERCLRGEHVMSFSAEEEMAMKTLWKQQANLREVGVTGPQLGNLSSGLRLMFDKIWVLIVCGDNETESGSLWTPNFEQRTKLQYIAWGPTQYVALQAALIKLLLPTLSDAAALDIGIEDLKADDLTLEAMTPAPGSSRVVGSGAPPPSSSMMTMSSSSSPGASRGGGSRGGTKGGDGSGGGGGGDNTLLQKQACAALEKTYAPVRGDTAYKIYTRQMSDFLHRWCATMTESEEITLLKATAPAMELCRHHAGLETEKPKRGSRRSASGSTRRNRSRRGR